MPVLDPVEGCIVVWDPLMFCMLRFVIPFLPGVGLIISVSLSSIMLVLHNWLPPMWTLTISLVDGHTSRLLLVLTYVNTQLASML